MAQAGWRGLPHDRAALFLMRPCIQVPLLMWVGWAAAKPETRVAAARASPIPAPQESPSGCLKGGRVGFYRQPCGPSLHAGISTASDAVERCRRRASARLVHVRGQLLLFWEGSAIPLCWVLQSTGPCCSLPEQGWGSGARSLLARQCHYSCLCWGTSLNFFM